MLSTASPVYAVRESLLAATSSGQTAEEPVILGILSLIVWALVLIVTLKCVAILLRADNEKGGTLALMALAQSAAAPYSVWIILLGIISAALFYGDDDLHRRWTKSAWRFSRIDMS